MPRRRSPTPSSDEPRERARALGLRYLAARARSVAELGRRLERAGAPPPVVDELVADFQRLGYLDDAAFARFRARSLLLGSRLGPRAALDRLARAGVGAAPAAAAVDEVLADSPEEALARAALGKRPYGPHAPRKDNARAGRFLVGRGFSGEVVARLIGWREDVDVGGGDV